MLPTPSPTFDPAIDQANTARAALIVSVVALGIAVLAAIGTFAPVVQRWRERSSDRRDAITKKLRSIKLTYSVTGRAPMAEGGAVIGLQWRITNGSGEDIPRGEVTIQSRIFEGISHTWYPTDIGSGGTTGSFPSIDHLVEIKYRDRPQDMFIAWANLVLADDPKTVHRIEGRPAK